MVPDGGATVIQASVGAIIRGKSEWPIMLGDGRMMMARRLIDASGRGSSLLRDYGQFRAVRKAAKIADKDQLASRMIRSSTDIPKPSMI